MVQVLLTKRKFLKVLILVQRSSQPYSLVFPLLVHSPQVSTNVVAKLENNFPNCPDSRSIEHNSARNLGMSVHTDSTEASQSMPSNDMISQDDD